MLIINATYYSYSLLIKPDNLSSKKDGKKPFIPGLSARPFILKW
ncbi:hypothetical protein HMPREF0201_02731 [Cedecea davisae DSM 4568]|uniref:Uncharacterized protein n=1 Tax=Cedecea davisae DSM 4568 TaxID=566551 RepID=S3IUW3_9ENTR|nr:hypothetical protein HMPREF0201_02731 [Cedecea davisae DSM 4568]